MYNPSPSIPLPRRGKKAAFTTSPQPSPNLGEGAVLHEFTSDRNAGEVNILFAKQTEKVYSPLTTHYSLCKKAAFTLAETLITLGIIGVVAAMTLPVLIQNHKKSVIETRLKKFYTSFNQAILMVKNEYGDYADWYDDFNYDNNGNMYDDEGKGNALEYTHTQFEKYFAKYLNIIETKKISNNYYYYFADGSAFRFADANLRDIAFYPNAKYIGDSNCKCTNSCYFVFLFNPVTNTNHFKYHYNKGMEPYKYMWDGEISSLYSDATYGCATNGRYCAAIIQLNGWKIPDDYPAKIR